MTLTYDDNGPSIIGATGHKQKVIGKATIRENELAQVLDSSFQYNLLSVSQDCTQFGVAWIFLQHRAFSIPATLLERILSTISEDDIHKYATRTNQGLYILHETIQPSTQPNNTMETTIPCLSAGFSDITCSEDMHSRWHQRIMHINDLSVLNGNVEGIPYKFSARHQHHCRACIEAKMTINQHRTPTWPRLKTTFPPMYHIIMDTLCPNILSCDNKKYKTSLVCATTGLVIDIYTHTREEIEDEVVKFVRFYRRSTHIIQCDNAGEFHDDETAQKIANEGVFFFYSVPHKSYYNGKVERHNRSSTNASNTMRFHATDKKGDPVPSICWTYAHRAYAHIYNRIPNSTGTPAPLAMITGNTQYIGHLRKLFCRVYALNPSEHRQKHEKRTIKGWHFGYPTGRPMPCYLIYSENTNRFFCTADCIFDETECLGNTQLAIYKRSQRGVRQQHNFEAPHLDSMGEAELLQLYDSIEESEQILATYAEHIDPSNEASPYRPKIFRKPIVVDDNGHPVPNIPHIDPDSFQYPPIRHAYSEADRQLGQQRILDLAGDISAYPHITPTSGDINMTPASLANDDTVPTFLLRAMNDVPTNLQELDDLMTLIQTNVTKDAPQGWRQAQSKENKPLWQQAINTEFDGFRDFNAIQLWERAELLQRDPNCVIIQHWVWRFTVKYQQNGEVKKRKARLAMNGAECIPNIHYDPKDTTSVVMSCAAFRLIVTLAAKFELDFELTDFTNAFLHADIERDLYAECPPGYLEYLGIDPSLAHQYIVKILKQIYGLPQANFYFTKLLFSIFQKAGLTPLRLEPAIYYRKDNPPMINSPTAATVSYSSSSSHTSHIIPSTITRPQIQSSTSNATTLPSLTVTSRRSNLQICMSHVDDLGHYFGDRSNHDNFMTLLTHFKMTIQTGTDIYLGKNFRLNERTGAYHLACKGLLVKTMHKLGITNSTHGKIMKLDIPMLTAPIPIELLPPHERDKIPEESRPKSQYKIDIFQKLNAKEHKEYGFILGVGNYVTSQVRPDMSTDQSILAKYIATPQRRHLIAAHQYIRNLLLTIDYELQLGGRMPLYKRVEYHKYLNPSYLIQQHPDAVEIIAMSDSAQHNHEDDRATQLGHIVLIDGSPIVWKSFHTKTIIKGVRDGELIAVHGIKDIPIQLAEIVHELGLPIVGQKPMILTDSANVCDNINARFSRHEKKYLDIQLQHLQHAQYTGEIFIHHIPRELNWADPLCKTELTTAERQTRKSRYFSDDIIIPIPNPLQSFSTGAVLSKQEQSHLKKSAKKRTNDDDDL